LTRGGKALGIRETVISVTVSGLKCLHKKLLQRIKYALSIHKSNYVLYY